MAKINGKYINDIEGDLPVELQQELAQVRASYKAHQAVTKAFEAKVDKYLGMALKYSYRFGKLSASVAEAKPEPVAKPSVTLAQWLEQQ